MTYSTHRAQATASPTAPPPSDLQVFLAELDQIDGWPNRIRQAGRDGFADGLPAYGQATVVLISSLRAPVAAADRPAR